MPVESKTSRPEKIVCITGASSGFGLAACEVYLKNGWTVYAAVRGGMKRADLFKHIWSHFPQRLKLVELDLTDGNTIDALAHSLAEKPLHALINNAGYGLFGAAEDMTESGLRRQMEVNFFGTFRLTQLLLPKLRSSQGSIVTISSVVGRHGLPLTSAYVASKFAVEGWMESLSMELQPFGVKCYLIEPGTFPTQFGTGIDWVQSPQTSVYKEVSEGYDQLRIRIFARVKNRSVYSVGEKMFDLVNRRPSALRHPIGPDSRATMLAARILSPNLLHLIATRLTNYAQRRYAPKA
ncbi:MAG: SDR family NAD(P)-dependent oxidoreductase [Bdellovibrionota bacterium]